MTTRGRLITLEGGEGAGKSTLASGLVAALAGQGRSVVQTREPGGSPLAEALRGLVLQSWDEGMTPQTEALIMSAARAAHWRAKIAPALAAGQWVICDRFIDSTAAYQGSAGVTPAQLTALAELAVDGHRPDLTLLVDLDPEVGLSRARQRGDGNRFEAAEMARHQRIRTAFLAAAAAEPQRFRVLDGMLSAEALLAAAIAAVVDAQQGGSA
ncbi:dTMP kinase [Polycyclovorans algicola]|uniref:dTMP kinase n=1 Tax=Polycyclovorans algicola TaxID=616992 RepID=UPI0004A7834B|nr:dTMP kinase [Polycyclovorans algicola]